MMIQEVKQNTFNLFIAAENYGNNRTAKHLIGEARKMVTSAKAEIGFGDIAREFALAETEAAKHKNLSEIAEWHLNRGIERLETAISKFQEVEKCAFSMKYRKYAEAKSKDCRKQLKVFKRQLATKNVSDFKRSFRNLISKTAMLFAV